MKQPCGRTFDESLLSGFLDGALSQQEEQRVRLHLEDCRTCRTLLEDLTTMRRETMSSEFLTPSDDQWQEEPRSLLSRLAFRSGWTLVVLYVIALTAFGVWQWLHAPGPWLLKLLVFGGVLGAFLLFASVVLDRLKTYSSDRYRRVQK